MNGFADCFKTRTRDSTAVARLYAQGLLTDGGRKNMEVMDGRLGADQYEALQQFISGSPWSSRELSDRICRRASERLGHHRDATLLIDESCHAKKGNASCGVARQYNGRLGKTDNCQVGVYSALQNGGLHALTGARLHLPKEWIEDRGRCLKAGVPEERIAQGVLTKIDLGRELVEDALASGAVFGCVCVDAFYGRDGAFRAFLREKELVYCCDVASNIQVFQSPPAREGAGVAVRDIGKELMEGGTGGRIDLREGENGIVSAMVWTRRVWVSGPDGGEAEEEWLIVRSMPDGLVKHVLSNAGPDVSVKQPARWSASRYYIERAFQDAKSHAGMSDYQCRGWKSWHHHMAMVCLATLFLMEERLFNPMEMPLLSARDIVEMLDWAFRSPRSEDDMIRHIAARHERRARNAAGARVRKRRELDLETAGSGGAVLPK